MKVFVLLLGLVLGCAESRQPRGTTDSPVGADLDAAVSGDDCESFQDAAEQLRADAEACQSDAECAYLDIDAPCLIAFLCPSPLSQTADIEHVREAATRLSVEYRACSNSCAVASCVGFYGTMCNPFTHRCEGRTTRD